MVHAGNGIMYQDTDPAGAGKVYRKSTPSGNTGWVELGAGGGGVGASHAVVAYGGDDVPLPASTARTLTFSGGAIADPEGIYDGPTGIYTAPEAGFYLFNFVMSVSGVSGTDVVEIDLTTPDLGDIDIWASAPVFKKTFTLVEHFGVGGDCTIEVTSWAGAADGKLWSFSAAMLVGG